MKKLTEKQERAVAIVLEKSDWSREEIIEKIEYAKANFGITFLEYANRDYYKLPVEALEEEHKNFLIKRERIKKRREEAVASVMKKTGWDHDSAFNKMKESKDVNGITFSNYDKFDLWKYPLDKQSAELERAQNPSAVNASGEKMPEVPFATKISSITNQGIDFYWKKPEIADGYEVFRSYDGEEFEKIVTLKRSAGNYVDSDFDHSKRVVYYKVRSFLIKEDGSYIYSDEREPKAAEFRTELILNRQETYLYPNVSREIKALYGWGEPEDAVFTSDNENVATISADGIITGVGDGECTITCESASVGQRATSRVIVNRKASEPLGKITSRFEQDEKTGIWYNPKADNKKSASIAMVGDLMCGAKQMNTQYDENEGWNFNDSYEYVKKIISSADFSVANLETLLAAGWPYMTDECYIDNKNNCNATPRYLDAVKYAGFDAVAMSNNHNCDGGTEALAETIDHVNRYKLINTGAFKSKDERRFFIADVNGIKVGFLAYMSKKTGFNSKDSTWTDEEKDTMLNAFSYEKAKKDIEDCRNLGAEYVIAYMHWGFKNFKTVSKHQVEEAQTVADAGVDYIVGANPHVLQRYDVIKSCDGRDVPCFYSTGNFQSIMMQIPENRDTIIVKIKLKRDKNGKVVLAENNYIPCHVYTTCNNRHWTPIALSPMYNLGLKKKNRQEYYNRVVKTIGDKINAL